MELRALKVRLVAIMVVTGFCVTAAVATAALVSVRSSQNGSLGAILVSSSGRTLYHLSSEKKARSSAPARAQPSGRRS